MKFCSNCGAQMEDNSHFCPACGSQADMDQTADQVTDAGQETVQSADTNSGSQTQTNGYAGQNAYGNTGAYQNNSNMYGSQGGYQNGNPNMYGYQQPYGYNGNDKAFAIIAHLTWIGWLVALLAGSNNGVRSPFLNFHLNQTLVILLFSLLTPIPFLGWLWGIFMIVCWIMSLVSACQGTMKEIPLLGKIKIIQ